MKDFDINHITGKSQNAALEELGKIFEKQYPS